MSDTEREKEFERQRHDMVATQIERRGVHNRAVLAAMRDVPRHRFVPERLQVEAYQDCPLPIGREQTISQPYIVGLMSELLEVGPGDKVLEIGAGSGYQAAVLAHMGCEIYTLEIVAELADSAASLVAKLGYNNVRVIHADGYKGWPEEAPFDSVIATASPERVPEVLVEQLKEGRRLVLPVGVFNQELYVIEKIPTGVTERQIIPVRFVPMVEHRADRQDR